MEKILSLLGFIKKAGRLVTGSNAVLRSILCEDAGVVFVTLDAGNSVKEKFKRLCAENDIKFFVFGNSEELGYATGEKNKVIYSVVEEGFSNRLIQLIENLEKQ